MATKIQGLIVRRRKAKMAKRITPNHRIAAEKCWAAKRTAIRIPAAKSSPAEIIRVRSEIRVFTSRKDTSRRAVAASLRDAIRSLFCCIKSFHPKVVTFRRTIKLR